MIIKQSQIGELQQTPESFPLSIITTQLVAALVLINQEIIVITRWDKKKIIVISILDQIDSDR